MSSQWARRWFLALVIQTNAGVLLAVDEKSEQPAQRPLAGNLDFAQMRHDFGRVKRGEKLSHRFGFVNSGTGPLSIQGIHASCGCTVATFDTARVYQPGDRGFIELTLDTANFSGRIDKSVTVMTNESRQAARNLTLVATVEQEIYAEPPMANFGDIDAAVGGVRLIKLKSIGAPIAIEGLRFNAAALEVVQTNIDGELVLKVSVRPNLQSGFFKDTIVVRNGSKSLPELPILVRANIKGSIAHAPAYLEFGAIGKRGTSTRMITLAKPADFKITPAKTELNLNGDRIQVDPEMLTIEPVAAGATESHVKVTLKNPGAGSGSVHGRVFLDTSDPNQGQLAVDFYAFFL